MGNFKKIYIEITNKCNLSCSFCPKTRRKEQFMDKELFEKILLEAKGYTDYLYFHVMGEPLLHPRIGEFLDMAFEYGFKVNITTNGTLIQKVGSSLINKPALRQINFSLHSLDDNLGNKPNESYLKNIFSFVENLKNSTIISLRLWNISGDCENAKNQHILNAIENEFKLEYSLNDAVVLKKSVKISENIYLNLANTFDWPDIKIEEISESTRSTFNAFCYGLRSQIAILVDGTVVPCCLDNEGMLNLGNIKSQSLEDVLICERARKIYEGFSRHEAVEELCKRCGFRTRF